MKISGMALRVPEKNCSEGQGDELKEVREVKEIEEQMKRNDRPRDAPLLLRDDNGRRVKIVS
jgi:hypothetical protein